MMKPKPTEIRYLDLSGYAFTGKHAVIDLIREIHGYSVAHFQFEFNLIRIQGGIRDLETALSNDWSPIRSDAAVRKFKKLAHRLAAKNSWSDPSTWFEAVGWNYDEFFNGQFTQATSEYLRELIQITWKTEWPYHSSELGPLEIFSKKLLRLLRVRSAFDIDYYLAPPDDFLAKTQKYLQSLIEAFARPGDHTVVMHNSFEPFNPSRAIRYFRDARSIIVDRDPRDVYVAQNCYVPPESNAKPSPYRPVETSPDAFCQRFKLMRQAALKASDTPGRVLRIKFEDLVLRYEETVQQILTFLGEDKRSHKYPGKYFIPGQSCKNIGIWKTYPDQSAIKQIAGELSAYCADV